MATNVKSKKSSLDEILECPLCLHQLTLPYTLQECLHTFCQPCIEAVPKKVNDGDLGWFCPMCRNFTKEDAIKQNFFINELISIHKMKDDNSLEILICKQCPSAKEMVAKWKCHDCKIELCNDCQESHLKIPILKAHKVVPLSTEAEKVVDHLILCPIHKDKHIEFNCQPCEKPLCINCKVLHHDGHKTETIEMALERLLPVINKENEKIKENEEGIRKQIREINAKIDETKEHFASCKAQINTQGEEMITQIKTIIKKRETQLFAHKSKAVKSLGEIKQELENKLSEVTNLTRLVTTSTSKARHVSLLNEIQGGLLERVKANVETKQKDVTAEISKPELKAEDLQSNVNELEKLLGEIQIKQEKFTLDKQGNMKGECGQSDCLCEDLVATFSKPLKKINDLSLPGLTIRVSFFDNKLWVSVCNETIINVYSTNGDLLQSVKGHGHPFRVIKKATNGDFVAGDGDDGLYVSQEVTTNWTEIAAGKFSDICVHNDGFSALEYHKSEVITFAYCKQSHGWKRKSSFIVNDIKQKSDLDTLLFDGHHFIICSFYQATIYKFTVSGHCVLQNQTKYSKPMLCGTDSRGNVLVLSWDDHKLFLLHEIHGKFIEKDTDVAIEGLSYPVDVTMDNEHNVWVLSSNNFKLIKYTSM